MPSAKSVKYLWVNKTGNSSSLSHSDDAEHIDILTQAQRVSRLRKSQEASNKQRAGSECRKGRSTKKQVRAKVTLHPLQLPTPHFDWTIDEQRGVRYFTNVAVLNIITSHHDLDFWKEFVPCLTEYHPAFRHLVVAIASTHELLINKLASHLNILALEQCNKATQSLLSSGLETQWLLASCLLVTAYHLLRGDLASADRSIQSGLQMVQRPSQTAPTYTQGGKSTFSHWDADRPARVLTKLAKQHGFKLWSPDIFLQFDKTSSATEPLIFETLSVKGPFTNSQEIWDSFRNLHVELLTRLMRNLARGARIYPSCALAQEALQSLSDFHVYCGEYCARIPPDDYQDKLDLMQLLMGFHSVYILFHVKVIKIDEMQFDKYIKRYRSMLDLATEILEASKTGFSIKHIDRIVNGTLFTISICCRDPTVRRRAVSLLKSQPHREDELVNWARALIGEWVIEIEERNSIVVSRDDVPESRRIHLVGMHCRDEDKAICLQYIKATSGGKSFAVQEEWSDWNPPPCVDSNISAQDIDNCIKGIMSTYTLYSKADVSQAPEGYLLPMYHHGRIVPVQLVRVQN